VSYEYTDSPKQSGITTPGSGSVTYEYSATTDRVEQVTGPAGTTTVEWEAGGERPEVIRDGNLYQRRCYDGAGRVTEVLNATEDVACGEMGERVVAGFQYGYDGRGNRTSELAFGAAGTRLTAYGYDAADRLTGVQYPGQAVVYQLAGDGTRLAEKEAPEALGLGLKSGAVSKSDLQDTVELLRSLVGTSAAEVTPQSNPWLDVARELRRVMRKA